MNNVPPSLEQSIERVRVVTEELRKIISSGQGARQWEIVDITVNIVERDCAEMLMGTIVPLRIANGHMEHQKRKSMNRICNTCRGPMIPVTQGVLRPKIVYTCPSCFVKGVEVSHRG